MTKIKLSLPTGNSVEKSLLSAFSVGEKKYVVMDAESVGSMGLPIILVSAFSGEKLSKILDQNEWTSVKEALKSISWRYDDEDDFVEELRACSRLIPLS